MEDKLYEMVSFARYSFHVKCLALHALHIRAISGRIFPVDATLAQLHCQSPGASLVHEKACTPMPCPWDFWGVVEESTR